MGKIFSWIIKGIITIVAFIAIICVSIIMLLTGIGVEKKPKKDNIKLF